MIIIDFIVFILLPISGVYQFLAGLFAIKRQRIKVGNWGHQVLYTGLPAMIYGVGILGFGLIILIAFFTKLYWRSNPFDILAGIFYPIIIYSIFALPVAIIARIIFTRQK